MVIRSSSSLQETCICLPVSDTFSAGNASFLYDFRINGLFSCENCKKWIKMALKTSGWIVSLWRKYCCQCKFVGRKTPNPIRNWSAPKTRHARCDAGIGFICVRVLATDGGALSWLTNSMCGTSGQNGSCAHRARSSLTRISDRTILLRK